MQTFLSMAQEQSNTRSKENHPAGAGPASLDYTYTYEATHGGAVVSKMTSRTVGLTEINYAYTDTTHVHAVTSLSDNSSFTYDAAPGGAMDGNMTYRDYDGAIYIQKFDVENPVVAALNGTYRRLVAIKDTQTLSVTQFVYEGSGNRVKTIYPDSSWTAFIGDHYEVESDNTTRSYYFLGGQRIAMRIQQQGQADQLYFFHTDHLGSTSLLSDENGYYVDDTEARYLPYGGYRIEPTAELTDHGFTGHKQQSDVGLIYMRARYYLPGLGRFLSADTIVPDLGNPQSYNRYSYVYNNPLIHIDPDGHIAFIIAIPLLVAGVAAIADWGSQVHDNMENNDMSFWDAVHHENLDEGEIVNTGVTAGAATYTVMAAAPAVMAVAGEGLMGVGLATGSTTIFSAGTSTLSASGGLAATIYGCNRAVSQPAGSGNGNRSSSPYSDLEDSQYVGPGKRYTATQKSNIIEANMKRNGGVVRSDLSGEILVQPEKSQSGLTPPQNEWQIDHIVPISKGGSNSYANAQVLSRYENRLKWDK